MPRDAMSWYSSRCTRRQKKEKEKGERKKKLRKNEKEKEKNKKEWKGKTEKNYTCLLSYTQKTKPSKKKCFMPFAQKSHSFHMKKLSQLISFALTKGIPIKDIIKEWST